MPIKSRARGAAPSSQELGTLELGALIDAAYELRIKRLAYEKQVNERARRMKAQEDALEETIIQTMSKSGLHEATGTSANATLKSTTCAKVTDWPAFWQWISKHRAYDLVQRRVADTAFANRIAAGAEIAGAEAVVRTSVSITRLK